MEAAQGLRSQARAGLAREGAAQGVVAKASPSTPTTGGAPALSNVGVTCESGAPLPVWSRLAAAHPHGGPACIPQGPGQRGCRGQLCSVSWPEGGVDTAPPRPPPTACLSQDQTPGLCMKPAKDAGQSPSVALGGGWLGSGRGGPPRRCPGHRPHRLPPTQPWLLQERRLGPITGSLGAGPSFSWRVGAGSLSERVQVEGDLLCPETSALSATAQCGSRLLEALETGALGPQSWGCSSSTRGRGGGRGTRCRVSLNLRAGVRASEEAARWPGGVCVPAPCCRPVWGTLGLGPGWRVARAFPPSALGRWACHPASRTRGGGLAPGERLGWGPEGAGVAWGSLVSCGPPAVGLRRRPTGRCGNQDVCWGRGSHWLPV